MNEIPSYTTFIYRDPNAPDVEVEAIGLDGATILGTLATLNIPQTEYRQMDDEQLALAIRTAILAQQLEG